MTANSHIGRLLGFLAMGLGLGCDSLIEHPTVPVPAVHIVSPAPNSALVQPGPSFMVEFAVERCSQPRAITLIANAIELNVRAQPTFLPSHYQATVQVRDVLEASDWPLRLAVRVHLEAHLTCADYGQEASPGTVSFDLSPVRWVESFSDSVYLLNGGSVPGSILAASADELYGYTRDRTWYGGTRAHVGLLRYVGQYLYVWSKCVDTICFNRVGTLFRLAANNLALLFGPHDPQDLLSPPVDIVSAPDPSRLLMILSRSATSSPMLRFTDFDFGNPNQIAIDVEPIAPARTRGGGEVVFLGFPRLGGASQVEVVAVSSGATIQRRPVGLNLDIRDVLVDLSDDGDLAAIFDQRTATLYRLQTATGALLGAPARIGDGRDATWMTLTFFGRDHLLLASNAALYDADFATGRVLWKQTPAKPVIAAAASGDGHVGLLTDELDLLVFDDAGQVVAEQGPLPSRFRLTSNLLSTNDGFWSYGLGNFVVSYQSP